MICAIQTSSIDLVALQQALGDRNWSIVAVCVILLAVRAAKLPVFGSFWEKIPKHLRPLIPVAMGIISGVGEALLAHRPWAPALLYGVISGLVAIGTDQAITKPLKKPQDINPTDVQTTVAAQYKTNPPLIEQASDATDAPCAEDVSKAATGESTRT